MWNRGDFPEPVPERPPGGITTEEIFAAIREPCDGLEPVVRYVLDAPGKRLRSALLRGAGRLAGSPAGPALSQAAALVELLHNGTLLHDDVMDHARIRRSRPAANRIWGDGVAVLAGDFLLAAAMDLALRTQAPVIASTAVDTLIQLVEGQMLEISNQGNLCLGEDTYLEIIRKKTASLTLAACRMGGVLAGGTAEQVAALEGFGLCLGLAFQMIDDLRDYTDPTGASGKEPGKDLAEGKVTLPVVAALRRADKGNRERIGQIFADEDRGRYLDELRALLGRHGGFAYTLCKARQSMGRALDCLSPFPRGTARQGLEEIALKILAVPGHG